MGGSSGGSSKTPTEQADNLKSKQRIQIIDLISEGPIFGPVDGLKSFYLNDTPVLDSNGNANFTGVDAEWTSGTQDQAYLTGYSDVENEIGVSTELVYATPIVKTVTDADVNRVRLTVGVDSLLSQDDDGDLNYATVHMQIQIQNTAETWDTVDNITITGKTTSQYLESHIINAPGHTPWSFRVVRQEVDSTSTKLQNGTYFSSYTEIIDAKLSYPNSAIVGTTIDYTGQFSGIPARTYDMKGLIVQVPSNYDPVARTYAGLWNGTFQNAWTDNPAWVFYDLVTNTRYGLGKRLGQFGCDKWALYAIAQFCDSLVDDGFGGQEPRFACNLYITDQRAAYDVLNDLASSFRGMPIWDGLQMTVVQDRPVDPVWAYTNANVTVDGFKYASSARKARHTAIQVSWVNPDNDWASDIEYVSDDSLIARYGLNVSQVTAFGCTSRGQANRVGRWILKTEQLETQTVTFDVGRDGLNNLPGDIITVADNDYAGARMGGRVIAFSGTSVTLDAPVEIAETETAYFSYLNDAAAMVKIQIAAPVSGSQITLASAPAGLRKWGIFTISKSSLATRLFRCLAITDNVDDGTYSITALQHDPNKQAEVDLGEQFDTPTTTLYGSSIPAPEHIAIDDSVANDVYQIRITWDTAKIYTGITFNLKLVRHDAGGDVVVLRANTADMQYTVGNLSLGSYSVFIRGMNAAGQLGEESEVDMTIGPPLAPSSLSLYSTNFSIKIVPVVNGVVTLGTRYQFYRGASLSEALAMANYVGQGYEFLDDGLTPLTTYWYAVRAFNNIGRSALVTGSIATKKDATDIMTVISDAIPDIEWARDLSQEVAVNTSAVGLLSDRAYLVVNNEGKVSGIAITTSPGASVVDILANYFAVTDPSTLQRKLYWDGNNNRLVIEGEVNAIAGTFQNVTIAQNCNILGTLTAAQISGGTAANSSIDLTGVSDPNGNATHTQDFHKNLMANSYVNRVLTIVGPMSIGASANGPGSLSVEIFANNVSIGSATIETPYINAEASSANGAFGAAVNVPAGTEMDITIRVSKINRGTMIAGPAIMVACRDTGSDWSAQY
ncbi:phage tail protein [Sodalis sp. dw_96]|uniref:host specificity protein J n=1 Tax=Sodalis sp. dw_96 TaxID=2719794 RepID=UPI001BD2C616|nr:phage tail protein [Sodalis sp. dw_96]